MVSPAARSITVAFSAKRSAYACFVSSHRPGFGTPLPGAHDTRPHAQCGGLRRPAHDCRAGNVSDAKANGLSDVPNRIPSPVHGLLRPCLSAAVYVEHTPVPATPAHPLYFTAPKKYPSHAFHEINYFLVTIVFPRPHLWIQTHSENTGARARTQMPRARASGRAAVRWVLRESASCVISRKCA